MSEEFKKHPIPKEIAELYLQACALDNLRDKYASLPFGYKKSRRAAMEADSLATKAHRMIIKLYPELKGKGWTVFGLRGESYLGESKQRQEVINQQSLRIKELEEKNKELMVNLWIRKLTPTVEKGQDEKSKEASETETDKPRQKETEAEGH